MLSTVWSKVERTCKKKWLNFFFFFNFLKLRLFLDFKVCISMGFNTSQSFNSLFGSCGTGQGCEIKDLCAVLKQERLVDSPTPFSEVIFLLHNNVQVLTLLQRKFRLLRCLIIQTNPTRNITSSLKEIPYMQSVYFWNTTTLTI